MPKKHQQVLCDKCEKYFSYTNFARHVALLHTPKKPKQGKLCIFCGKIQKKLRRHLIESCSGSRLNRNYQFRDQDGFLVRRRGEQVLRILRSVQGGLPFTSIGGDGKLNKSACAKHVLQFFPYTEIDCAFQTFDWTLKMIKDAKEKIVLVDYYDHPSKSIDLPDKMIFTVSDDPSFEGYLVRFNELAPIYIEPESQSESQ